MIVGYARISTVDQNMDMQLDALKHAGCERIFQDKASGSRDDRKELVKCLGFLQTGDVLVLWKLDRLGRSLKHLINTVLGLNERGVNIVITTMSIDTRTPTGKLIFGILASIADFERELIRERVNAGIAAAKARGVKFGRPSVISDVMLAEAKARVALDESVRDIATDLGVSKTALYAAL